MATNSLPSESVLAKPLTLFDAVNALDDVRGDLEQLDSLLYVLGGSEDVDKRTREALRSAARLAEALAERAGDHSAKFLEADRAARGDNVADFSRRG